MLGGGRGITLLWDSKHIMYVKQTLCKSRPSSPPREYLAALRLNLVGLAVYPTLVFQNYSILTLVNGVLEQQSLGTSYYDIILHIN